VLEFFFRNIVAMRNRRLPVLAATSRAAIPARWRSGISVVRSLFALKPMIVL
jgi:hypothetical protein